MSPAPTPSRWGRAAFLALGLLGAAAQAAAPESSSLDLGHTGGLLVTGDIHGLRSWERLLEPAGVHPGDRLLVLGDFGLVWDGGPAEKAALDRLDALPWEILFIDGNHENFGLLERYAIEERFGGRVRRVRGNVFQLLRGEVYTIGGRRVFTFGGGHSADRARRRPGLDWWPEEQASREDKENALRNLAAAGWRVDYLLTHEPSHDLQLRIQDDFGLPPEPDEGSRFIASLKDRLSYTESYSGHFHVDLDSGGRDHIVRNRVIRLF